jgi:predicted DCC family thiol-disulfide oxidoreductase YuxK
MGACLMDTVEPPRTAEKAERAPLEIIYDGECPFCRAYVRLVKLKEAVGPVELIDGRRNPAMTAQLRARGIDLNETMVVNYGGASYVGPRAIEMLSLLSSDSGLVNRMMARLLRNGRRADFFYPILRFGRNSALRLLGKGKIDMSGRS